MKFKSNKKIFNTKIFKTDSHFNCWNLYVKLIYISVVSLSKGKYSEIEIIIPRVSKVVKDNIIKEFDKKIKKVESLTK